LKKLICLVLLLGGQAGAGYIPDMPYFHQYSNRLNPSGSCQNTCIAIVLKYYGADDITPDKISAKWGTYIAQTTGGLEKIFNAEAALRGLPVRDLAANAGTLRELHGLLDAGRPVIVHGGFSEVGHLMVLVGYDERYYYAMDPASKWTERVNGGFTNRDDPQIGRYTRYRREAVEAAIISSANRNQIRMHQIYFEHGALAARWEGALVDSVALGESVAIAGGVRLDSGRVAGVRVVADLRELGGPGELELSESDPGFYPLARSLQAGGASGRRTVSFRISRDGREMVLRRSVVILPRQSQVVFAGDYGAGWQLGFNANAEVAVAAEGLEVRASGFTLEFLPHEPVDLSGYRALRFAFRRGEAVGGSRPAFSVQINEDIRKVEPLVGGSFRGVDLARDDWQTVEVPLWAFAPVEEPLRSIRLFGNLRGTFYLDGIELVSARFPPPHIRADWHSALPDSLVAGAELVLREEIRVASTEPAGPAPEVVADLSALGGPRAQVLPPVEPGVYRLETAIHADIGNGRKQLRISVRQAAAAGPLETVVSRDIVVLPRGDQIVFDEGYGDNWQRGFVANADLDDAAGAQVYAGSLAQELAAAAFTLEYKPRQAVDPVGYRALRLAIHPGDADGGARPAFNIMVNGDTPSLVQLIGGDIAGLGLDLDRGEWQVVEIPLALFYRLDGPIESLRLFGNLRGTFYIDDVRLVAAQTRSQPTAVLERRKEGVPELFTLAQNYPNPFNSSTVIRYDLAVDGEIELSVFNLLGQLVVRLAEGSRRAGHYTANWDGRDASGRMLTSGLYVYRLQTPQGVQTRKFIVLR